MYDLVMMLHGDICPPASICHKYLHIAHPIGEIRTIGLYLSNRAGHTEILLAIQGSNQNIFNST